MAEQLAERDIPWHPFCTRALTAASPIPLEPPTTMATLPLRSGMSSSLYRFESSPAGLTIVNVCCAYMCCAVELLME